MIATITLALAVLGGGELLKVHVPEYRSKAAERLKAEIERRPEERFNRTKRSAELVIKALEDELRSIAGEGYRFAGALPDDTYSGTESHLGWVIERQSGVRHMVVAHSDYRKAVYEASQRLGAAWRNRLGPGADQATPSPELHEQLRTKAMAYWFAEQARGGWRFAGTTGPDGFLVFWRR